MSLIEKIRNYLKSGNSSEGSTTRIYYNPTDKDFFPPEQENIYRLDFSNLALEGYSHSFFSKLVKDAETDEKAYKELEHTIRNFEDIVRVRNQKPITFFRAATEYLGEHQEDFDAAKAAELYIDLLENAENYEEGITVKFHLVRTIRWKNGGLEKEIVNHHRDRFERVLEDSRGILKDLNINNDTITKRCYKIIHTALIEQLEREDVKEDLIQELKESFDNSQVFQLNADILEEVDENRLIEVYRELFQKEKPFGFKQKQKPEMRITEKLAEEEDSEMHEYLREEIMKNRYTLREIKTISELLANYQDPEDFESVAERYNEKKNSSTAKNAGLYTRLVLKNMVDIDRDRSYRLLTEDLESDTITETKKQILSVIETNYEGAKVEEPFRKSLEKNPVIQASALPYFLERGEYLPEKVKQVLQSDEVNIHLKEEILEEINYSKDWERTLNEIEDEEVQKLIEEHFNS